MKWVHKIIYFLYCSNFCCCSYFLRVHFRTWDSQNYIKAISFNCLRNKIIPGHQDKPDENVWQRKTYHCQPYFLTIPFYALKVALFLHIPSGFTFFHFVWSCITAVDHSWSWIVWVDIGWYWLISAIKKICLFTNIKDIVRQSVSFQLSSF